MINLQVIPIPLTAGVPEGKEQYRYLKKKICRYLPGIGDLLSYRYEWLKYDLIAGLVVFAVLIPSNLAYGELAGFHPVVGLYAGFVAMLVYALFTNSRQIIVGPESTSAILLATTILPLAAGDYVRYTGLAATLAILIGLICIFAGRFKLGFVSDFFSKPILSGYIAGTSLMVVASQLGKLFGITLTNDDFFPRIYELITKLDQTRVLTLVFGIIIIIVLLSIRYFTPKIPGPLIVVISTILISSFFHLEDYGFKVVGEIVGGLPSFQVPVITLTDIQTLFPPAIAISVILFTDGTLTGRLFAKKNHYALDSNKELIAFGSANLCTGLFQSFPVGASQTKSAVNNSSGGKSQLSGMIAACLVIIFLMFCTFILHNLPIVALAAIVIVAGISIIDLQEFITIYHARRSEFYLALFTLFAVLIFGLVQGVAFAVGFSLLEFIKRIYRPHTSILGIHEGVDGFHGLRPGDEKQFFPGLVVYGFDAPLFFANASYFVTDVKSAISTSDEPVRFLLIDVTAVPDLDSSAADAFKELYEELQEQGITVGIAGANCILLEMMEKTGIDEMVGKENIFPTIRAGIISFGVRYLEDES